MNRNNQHFESSSDQLTVALFFLSLTISMHPNLIPWSNAFQSIL
jgi:hypothetical protein